VNGRPALLTIAITASVAIGCGTSSGGEIAAREPVGPMRPVACRDVGPATFFRALETAADGEALCLRDGAYSGPVEIARAVIVWGSREAVIRSSGDGTTVRVSGDGAALLGVTVDGSGGRYDLQDAAVAVSGDDVTVEGVRVVNAVFGILVQRANRVAIRGNEVTGDRATAIGLRGDAIRLWETRDSVIEANRVRDSRDLVVWYSPRNRIEHNHVTDGRYGAHLMYSDGNTVTGNRFTNNAVGVFVMYSHDIVLAENEIDDGGSAAGTSMGLGIKDSGNLVVRRNRFARLGTGIFVDESPQVIGETIVFERNAIRGTGSGMTFHGRAAGNTLSANDFASNREHVVVEGGGDAQDATWEGNHFDDYAGYDFDDDGAGDVPYEARSLASDVARRHPNASFFRGTAAYGVVDALGRIVPLFRPRTLLVDARPAVGDPTEL
jgi:nitrous oxidase accessory protein